MVLGPVNLTLCEIEVKFKKYFTKSIRSQDGLIQQKKWGDIQKLHVS